MIIRVDKTDTIEGFNALVNEMEGDSNVRGLLILACDGNGSTPDAIDDTLKKVSVPLFGGVFQ